MAIVWGFSMALRFGPPLALGTYRVVTRGQPTEAWTLYQWIRNNAHLEATDLLSDAELSALMSAEVGYSVSVATWAEEVDLRKLQVRYSRAPAGGTLEDVAVTTHTFLKAPGGVASGVWTDPTDYAAVETAFNTFFTAIKAYFPVSLHLDQYRWYLDNSAMRLADHAPNPALRITEVDNAGTAAGTQSLPPQIAVSVTEVTANRKSWGRFYLPVGAVAAADLAGRFAAPALFAGHVETFYNSCRSAGLVPVVFAPGLPARSSASARRAAALVGPGTAPALDIPARTGVIYEVTAVQVDDLFDVIRSRRWDRPVVRSREVIV